MKAVDDFLQEHIKENNSPSVNYLLFNKEKIIHRFSSGFADMEKQKGISEHTTYNAFSVTKTFTAVAILQLAEKKLLHIDDAVKKYLPGFPYSPEITIRQLLAHSAGIPNPIPLGWIHPAKEHAAFDRNVFFSNLFAKNSKVKFKPNEKFSYSNLGYVLLGQLIEKVSGTTYENYIHDHILAPLHLQPHELGFTISRQEEHAKGYHKRFSFSNLLLALLIDKPKYMNKGRGRWQSFKDYYINGVSYGGLIGTANALATYVQELLKPGCALLSDEYKELLFRENHTSDGKATGMCLSWFCGQLKGAIYFAHAGGGGGYYCEIRIYPALGLGSVIMFNRTGMTDARFLDRTDNYFIHEQKGGQ